MRFLLTLAYVLLASLGSAATFNVSTSWSNIPWASVNPGDVIYVSNITSGSLTVSKSGTAGNPIWIVKQSGTVTSGAVTLSARSYINIVGVSFSSSGTVIALNSGSSNNKFIDCAITGGTYGVQLSQSSTCNNNLFRGMTITGLQPGTDANRYAMFTLTGDNNVVEYCTTDNGSDFVRPFGNYNIARNNYIADRDVASTNHIDDLQGYGNTNGPSMWTINNLFEANLSSVNTSSDAHGYIIQDDVAATLGGGLIRGNIHYRTGRNIGEWNNWPDTYVYNNTFVDCWAVTTTWADLAVWIRGTSTGHVWGNNIFDTCSYDNKGQPFDLDSPATLTVFASLEYLTGNPTGDWIEDQDPLITNPAAGNFMIASGSPARNAGRYLTLANGSGSSTTTLVVDEARFFSDGWDMVDGDIIEIGASGTPVRVTDINYGTNTLTLAEARTWADNAPVSIVGWDTDIGALAYRAGGYTLTGSLNNTGTSYTVTPNDANLVRMVVFYEDGIPQTPDYDSPYTYTSAGGTVTAKLYHRWASTTPVVNATAGGGDVTAPTVSSAAIASSGTSFTLTLDENVSFGAGGNGGLTLSATGGAVTATYSSGAGSNVLTYGLSRTIAPSETVTRSYTQPGNGIEDVAGNDLASFSGQAVTNNSTADLTAPTPNPMTFSVAPAAGGSTFVTMTASTASDATGPVQYYFDETTGNAGGTDSGWQTSASYTDTGLTAGTLYTYRVRARDAATVPNETAYSSTANATTLALPATPTSLVADAQGPNLMAVTWTDNATGESGYLVERSTTSGSGFTVVASLAANSVSYSDALVVPETTYYYRVRAYRDPTPDYSAYSSEASDTTPATAPPNPPVNPMLRIHRPRTTR